MDHLFVFNSFSFPAKNSDEAYELLCDASKGLLAVGYDNDRYTLYTNLAHGLYDYEVAPRYKYGDFLDQLGRCNEHDLQLALYEIEDKTPMIDFFNDEEIENLAESSYFFPDQPYNGSVDIIAVAWCLGASFFSIATADKWCKSEIEFAEYDPHNFDPEKSLGNSYIRNISCEVHGNYLRREYDKILFPPLSQCFPLCKFTQEFNEWNDGLPSNIRNRIRDKLALANTKKFQGGKPLFDTLKSADGLREIRFSAVEGGAIRILFGNLPHNHFAILVGFIKKSDDEGYKQAIADAKELWQAINEDS